jgi:hypothetical protein
MNIAGREEDFLRNIFMKFAILALIAVFVLGSSNSSADQILPGDGVTFYQIDLTYTGAEQPDSRYALVVADFGVLHDATGISNGYLNIVTDQGWVVRNMPVDAPSGCQGFGTRIDLGDDPGDISTIVVYADLSTIPSDNFTAIPNTDFLVGDVNQNAQGFGVDPVPGPFNISIDATLIIYDPAGLTDAFLQPFGPNVEQDDNQCAPGSVANSLQWLEDTYGIDVPHEHVPGIRDNSLVGELDQDMGRPAHQGIGGAGVIGGKLRYMNDNGLADDLVCKHKNGPAGNPAWSRLPERDTTVGDATSEYNDDPDVSLIDWVIAEVNAGEDVELGWIYPGGGGHFVRVFAGGHILGVPWIGFLEDSDQGADGDQTDENGGVGLFDGGVGFSNVVNNKVVQYPSSPTIACAISESPKPKSFINKELHQGVMDFDIANLEISLAGELTVVDHYDGYQEDWHFTSFDWFLNDQNNTILRWWDPVSPDGIPGPIPYCTWVHIGWALDQPARIPLSSWTDIMWDPIPEDYGIIQQIGPEILLTPELPEDALLRLHYDIEIGDPPIPATVSDIYYLTIELPFPLDELKPWNPLLDPSSSDFAMTLLDPGPIEIDPGTYIDLIIPGALRLQPGPWIVYRFNGRGQNEFIDIGQQEVVATAEDIPTLTEWGMIILGLLLLTAGTIAAIRRRKAAVAGTD